MVLPPGKIPAEILKKTVFEHLGAKRNEVILGPALGLDGALVRVGSRVLISSMDPITGAVERIGWLGVNVNANDVATFGVRPSLFSSCILLPEDSDEETVRAICEQIDFAAKKLGIAVVGGHTEVSPGLNRPILVGCALGITEPGKYVTSNGSESGNKLILTKAAGIEGTAVLATERENMLRKEMGEELVKSAQKFYDRISVVEDAILAFNKGGITAMHDPTEGGIAGGIHELADAADLGVKIFREKIPVLQETSKICKFFRIDPLQLIGSGALLISARPNQAKEVTEELIGHGIPAIVIGEFLDDPAERILVHNSSVSQLIRPKCDNLWIALGKQESHP